MENKQFNMTSLFGTPLYQTIIQPNITVEELNFVKNLEYKRFDADNGYGSKEKFLLDEPELKNLKERLLQYCGHYLYDVLDFDETQATFEITNSWSVKHLDGDESGPHLHAGSMFSAVYYIQTDNDCGDLILHKDETNYNILTPTVNVPFKQKNYNICNSEAFSLPPVDNMLVMFPSTLLHSVNPNKSSIERYCIAFNLFAFGKFNEGKLSSLGLKNITNT